MPSAAKTKIDLMFRAFSDPIRLRILTWVHGRVDIVCQAIDQGTSSAPDVSAVAAPAATSLIASVGGRNRVLGLPDLAGETADSVRKLVVQDISDIADVVWRDNRSRDGEKRRKRARAPRERLQWSSFEAVQ